MFNKLTSVVFRSATLVMIALFISAGSAFAQKKEKKEKPLEGKVFNLNVTEESQKKATKPLADEVTFKGDKLKSKVLAEKYKFKPGSYTSTIDSTNVEEPIINFEAEMTGETPDDKLHWKGSVDDEGNIEGTATWSKKGKVKREFSYSGLPKTKK
jgi:hypothetical protein